MKAFSALVGLLLAGIVLAQQPFVPGKQYEFLYEGRVASGLIGVAPQYAGLGIKAKIICTAKDPENIVVEIREPRIGKLNQKLRSEQAFYVEELPISYSPIGQYAKEIQTPFVVSMRSGLVTSIKMEEREPTIIKNIKRSVASMIQMNIDGIERFPQKPEMMLPQTEENKQKMSFTVMEESTLGVCETLYTISPLPEYIALAQEAQIPEYLRKMTPEGHLIVTKAINLDNCIKKSSFHHVAPQNEQCTFPEAFCNATQARSSYTRYLIEGKREQYTLKAIWSEGNMIVRPAEADVKILSHQTLHLQSVSSRQAPSVNPSSTYELLFDIPTMTPGVNRLDQQTLLEKPIFPLEPSLIKEITPSEVMPKIHQLLEEVSKEVEEYRRPEEAAIPMKVQTIVKGIQMLKYQDLKTVTRQIVQRNPQEQKEQTKMQVYLDCLALAGTNPSILVIKDLISEGILKGERAAQVLMTLPMTLTIPVPQIIEKLVEIVQLQPVRSESQVYSTALLTLSHVTYKACINQNISRSSYPVHLFREEICKPDSEVVLQKVLPLLKQALTSARNQHEKEVAIRALGNLAHPQVLYILKPYIWGSEQTKEVQLRTMAILSLERLAKLSPKQVREILVPVMSNPMDHYEPRISAVTMLLETNPPPALFQQIALMTWFEPSAQVKSYIWTTFKTLSNVTYPTKNATEMARKSEMALLMTKPVEEGIYYSRNLHFNNYVTKLNAASLLHVSSVSSMDSLIPRTIYAQLYSYLFGYQYSPLKVTIFNQGTQNIINKLVFPQVARKAAGSLPFDFWSQSGSEILNKIKTDIKKSDLPRGSLQMKMYDSMERIFSYDETNSIIRELIEQQTLNLEKLNGQKQINYQKVLPQREYLATIPTELGFPLVVSLKMPIVLSLRGQIQSQIQPARITPSMLLKNEPKLKVEVKAEIKPLLSVQRLTTASIVTPFFHEELVSGVEQHSELAVPGSLYFKLDTSARIVELDYTPAQRPSEVFVAVHNIRPFTALYNPVEMKPLTLCPEFKIIHKEMRPIQRSIEFGQKYLGLDLMAQLETEKPVIGFSEVYHLLQHHSPLTAFNFIWALPRPVTYQKMAIVFRSSNSETKTIKTVYEYKNHMLPQLRSVADEYYESYRPSRISSDRYMWQDTEYERQPKYESLYNQGLPMSHKYLFVSYKGAINQTVYATFKLEGSSPRIYEAMVSMVNYTTPDTHTVNVTMGFRMEQVPSVTPAACYVESVLQLPVLKERRIQKLINSPVYAIASTNITLPEHKMIQFRVKMQRDEQQKQFVQMTPEYKRCQENEQQGWEYSYNCTIAKMQATTLNNITAEIAKVGTHMPETLHKLVYSIDHFVKYMWYPHMQIDPTINATKPSDVEIYLRRDPFRKVWDIEAKKPYEVTRFYNLREVPVLSKYLLPLTFYLKQDVILPKHVVSEQLIPSCIAQRNFLKTFDNVTLPLRGVSPNCWHLLVKDCSDEVKFGVFIKPSQSGKEVKAVLGQTEVHFIPSGQQPQVTINGKQVHLTPETLIHPVYEHEQGYPVVSLRLLPSNKVELYSPLYKVKVIHDGQNVLVEPFSMYRGRLCGLCGDLNGERAADLKTPEMCALNTTYVKEFFSSWVVPEGSCHPYKLPEQKCHRPQYLPTGEAARVIAPGSMRSSLNSELSYDLKHIKTQGQRGDMCYSFERVKVCKPGYKASSYEPKNVDFFCVRQGEPKPSPQERHVDLTERIPDLPRDCVRQ